MLMRRNPSLRLRQLIRLVRAIVGGIASSLIQPASDYLRNGPRRLLDPAAIAQHAAQGARQGHRALRDTINSSAVALQGIVDLLDDAFQPLPQPPIPVDLIGLRVVAERLQFPDASDPAVATANRLGALTLTLRVALTGFVTANAVVDQIEIPAFPTGGAFVDLDRVLYRRGGPKRRVARRSGHRRGRWTSGCRRRGKVHRYAGRQPVTLDWISYTKPAAGVAAVVRIEEDRLAIVASAEEGDGLHRKPQAFRTDAVIRNGGEEREQKEPGRPGPKYCVRIPAHRRKSTQSISRTPHSCGNTPVGGACQAEAGHQPTICHGLEPHSGSIEGRRRSSCQACHGRRPQNTQRPGQEQNGCLRPDRARWHHQHERLCE